jgi:hypothetical protein
MEEHQPAGASQVRNNQKPFTVFQPIPGQNFPSSYSSSTPIRSNRPARSSRPGSRARPSPPRLAGRSKPTIPDTSNGLPAMACISAMQKAIRRGMEREAMQFAVEFMHTFKAFRTMVCNRLEVICHDDLDTLAAPHVFPFVAASLAASRER